jgi:hypothetical protein
MDDSAKAATRLEKLEIRLLENVFGGIEKKDAVQSFPVIFLFTTNNKYFV